MLVLPQPSTLTASGADRDLATILLGVVPGVLLLLLSIPELVTAFRAERGVKRGGQAFYAKIVSLLLVEEQKRSELMLSYSFLQWPSSECRHGR